MLWQFKEEIVIGLLNFNDKYELRMINIRRFRFDNSLLA